MNKPIKRYGFFDHEAAAALKITLSQFTIEVAAGTIPPAFYRGADGVAQWHCGTIGTLVAERHGPQDLCGLVDSLQRIHCSDDRGQS